MRGARLLSTSVVAAAFVAATFAPAPASVASGATAGSTFCDRAEELVAAIGDIPSVDFTKERPRRRFFRRLDQIVTGLERTAPKSLRKTFRMLRPVYDAIAENTDNLGLFSEPPVRKALNRLARYGRNECDLDLPTF